MDRWLGKLGTYYDMKSVVVEVLCECVEFC